MLTCIVIRSPEGGTQLSPLSVHKPLSERCAGLLPHARHCSRPWGESGGEDGVCSRPRAETFPAGRLHIVQFNKYSSDKGIETPYSQQRILRKTQYI